MVSILKGGGRWAKLCSSALQQGDACRHSQSGFEKPSAGPHGCHWTEYPGHQQNTGGSVECAHLRSLSNANWRCTLSQSKLVLATNHGKRLRSALSSTESRIARFPKSRAWNRQIFCSRKHKIGWNRHKVAESRKIDSESTIRIATYQCLAATLESLDSNRPILKRPILDSESQIQCH